jgi:nitrate/nitrite transport system ATP-binding protein
MITHDVDEAIYLADRILLMTSGPRSTIGREVRVDVPRPRDRRSLLRDPRYYEVRGQLVEFLSQGGPKPRPDSTAATAPMTAPCFEGGELP